MPSQPPLPLRLIPYISPIPYASLTLITSVLGATSNWLVLRFLYAALSDGGGLSKGYHHRNNDLDDNAGTHAEVEKTRGRRKVLLVSFLRDLTFWKAEAKRLGLDLTRLSDQGHFAFVDGLSDLFSAPLSSTASQQPTNVPLSRGPLPVRERTIMTTTTLPARAAQGAMPERLPSSVPRTVAKDFLSGSSSTRLRFTGRGVPALDALKKDILEVIQKLRGATTNPLTTTAKNDEEDCENQVLLIIDQPDFLLAATGPSQGIGATEVGEWILGLQEHVFSTVLTMAADAPLVHNASTTSGASEQRATPLEEEHAAFLIATAHRSRMVMQLRNLDTGAAKDVSGVLRISKGGGATEDGGRGDEVGDRWEPKEMLYFVQRDAGVRVFERGE